MKAELDLKVPLSKGGKGSAVKRAQELLTLSGFATGIDADFGGATLLQVQSLQKARGLPVTGVIDLATHEVLVEPLVRAIAPLPKAGMTLSQLTLAYALQHIAQHPREAGGDNRGPWVRAYLGWDGLAARWCAGFTCYALEQAAFTLGVKPPIASSASCDVLALAAQATGRFVKGAGLTPADRPTVVKPGSFFLVRAAPRDWIHVGIVVEARGDAFRTAEGNTNDEGSENGYEAVQRVRGYKDKDFIIW
jgi:hypothetical protein